MATVAQLEAALMKADAAGDEAAAREIAGEIKRTRAMAAPKPKATAKPLPRTRGSGIGLIDAPLDTINEAIIGVFEGPYNAAAMITDPISRMIFGDKAVTQAQAQRKRATDAVSRTFVTQPRPLARELGKTIGPAAAVSRGAALAAPILQKLPVVGNALARTAQAVASGGIGVQAPTRTARAALRVAGGSASGAASAALTGQDVTTGAAFGAGIPIVGSVLKRVGGKAVDLTRLSKVKAGEVIRQLLGANEDAARAAFASLSPDDQRLAQQVLIEAGIEPSPFFGVGKIVAREVDPDTPARILATQEAQRNARMAALGGGETATARRGSAEVARRDVSKGTGPVRDAALDRANVAGRVVPTAEDLATAARQGADNITASGVVPRMRGLETRSREQIDAAFQNSDFFTQGGPINRTGAIADGAGQRADNAIDAQIGLRDTARDMEDLIADMAAEGMTPLKVSPIVSQLRRMAGQPGTRADKLQRTTLTRLATELEGLADTNGVIDARDLYQIRKTGLNDIVDRLLGSRAQPSSGTKERTASLLTELRPMIDDAIEGAGGTNWKDYLVRTRQGFETVNRQELSAAGAKMVKENPDEFIALMRGERPDIVEGIMGKGTGQYDIGGMALADPRRYNAMMQSSNELQTLNRMNELAGLGEGAGGNILLKEQPSYLSRGLRAVVGAKFPAVAFAAQGANQVQRAIMSPRVQKELADAYASGPNMLNAMNQFPTAVKMSNSVREQLSPTTRNSMAQMINQYFNQ